MSTSPHLVLILTSAEGKTAGITPGMSSSSPTGTLVP